MALNAIQRTTLNFNHDNMCNKTLKIYSELLDNYNKNEK